MIDQDLIQDWFGKSVFVCFVASVPICSWISLRFAEIIEDEQEDRIPWWLTGFAKILTKDRSAPFGRTTSRVAVVIASLFLPMLMLYTASPESFSVRILMIFLAAVLAGLAIAVFEWVIRSRDLSIG